MTSGRITGSSDHLNGTTSGPVSEGVRPSRRRDLSPVELYRVVASRLPVVSPPVTMVGGARPVIRTSHEARRRSSVAVSPSITPEQLQNLSLLTTDATYGRASPDGRRASYGHDGKSTPSPLPSPRRGSLNPPWPVGTSGGPSMARRKSAFKDGKPPLRRFDTFNMEIKKSRIVFTVVLAAGGCMLVAIVSYAIKAYL